MAAKMAAAEGYSDVLFVWVGGETETRPYFFKKHLHFRIKTFLGPSEAVNKNKKRFHFILLLLKINSLERR